jgi:hypothetical protein
MKTDNADSKFTWKMFSWLAGILFICCLFAGLYSAGMFLIVKEDVRLLPAATLDLACEDTYCLHACMGRMSNFGTASLYDHRDEIRRKPLGYELARYRLEDNGQLKRIATPSVPDYLKSYQDDTKLHQRIWDYSTGIFPNDSTIHISYMTVYVDMSEARAAAKIVDLDGKWRLFVNLADFDSPQAVIDILTHEYGHMLTLNSGQVGKMVDPYFWIMHREDFDQRQATCGDFFFTGWECTSSVSYLNAFGNRFWTGGVYEAWINAFLTIHQADVYKAAVHEFYSKYPDQFVSEYAATSPKEDIAESWSEFVMRPKPTGTSIAEQKVQFFYEYPELVEIRRDILQGVCKYASEEK